MITSHWHIVVSPHTYCGMVSVHMHLAPFPGLHASFCYCTNSKWQKLSGSSCGSIIDPTLATKMSRVAWLWE